MGKRRRVNALVLMLLPAFVLLAAVGYLLCSLDYTRQTKPKPRPKHATTPKDDGVTFLPNLPENEEKQKITQH